MEHVLGQLLPLLQAQTAGGMAVHESVSGTCETAAKPYYVFLISLCFQFTNFVHLNFPSDIRNLSSCMSYCTPLNFMSWKCLAPSICCHIGILFLSSGLKYCFYLTKSEKGFFSYFVLFHLCIHRYSIDMKCEIDETIQNLYSNKIHDLLWL